jgi:hypothetical protein
LIELCATDILTPIDKPLLCWFEFELYATGVSVTPTTIDKFHTTTYLYKRWSLVLDGTLKWTQSTADPSEYYLTNEAGTAWGISGEVITDIDNVWENGTKMTYNSGDLAVGEWCRDDRDTLGFNTVYVRLTDDANPDGKADHYLLGGTNTRQYYSQYYTGYMMYSGIIGDTPSYIHVYENPGTHPLSISMETRYINCNGSITTCKARQMDLVVFERKR